MDKYEDMILGLEYYDGLPVPTGFAKDGEKNSTVVALEAHIGEIQSYGMSKDVHAAVESIMPGTFKRTNLRKLTLHRSRTGQQVAVEEISDALKIAGGAVVAGAGIFGLWKLIKFLMGKFKKGDDGDDKDTAAELKKDAATVVTVAAATVAAAERSVEKEVKAAQADNQPIDEAVVTVICRGIDDKDYVHKLGELAKKYYHSNQVYIPFMNAMAHACIRDKVSAAVFSRTADLVAKHPLTKRFPQYMFGLATMSHPLPALAVCVLGGKIPEMPTVTASDLDIFQEYVNIFTPEFHALMELDPENQAFATQVAAQASAFKRKTDSFNERSPLIKSLLESSGNGANEQVGIHFNTQPRGGFSKIILPPENGPIAEALASFFEAGGMPVNSVKLTTGVSTIFHEFEAGEKFITGESESKVKAIEESAMKGSARSAYVNYIGYLKKQFKTLATALGACRKQQAAIRYGIKWCRSASKTRLSANKPATENYGDYFADDLQPFITVADTQQE